MYLGISVSMDRSTAALLVTLERSTFRSYIIKVILLCLQEAICSEKLFHY